MNKTLLSFRGPAHHGQLMRPVEDTLERRGWTIVRYTTDTEGCFQAGLNEELGYEYEWLNDYTTSEWRKIYMEAATFMQGVYSTANSLSLMIPQINDRIVQAICREWVATRELVKKIKPTACIVLHELNRWGMMLGYHASRANIPVYSFQEGLYYGDKWLYTGHTRFSTSLVWGEATKRKLIDSGCGEGRVKVVGHPDLGKRWKLSEQYNQGIWEELPVDFRGKRICVVFFTNVEVTEQAEKVMEGIEGQDEWVFVARIHQLASAPYIEKVKKLFTRKHCWFSDNYHTFGHHWQLLSLSQALIVVGCSSTFLEYATSGKPMGQVRSNYMYRDFAQEGIAVDVTGITLVQSVQKIMNEWDGCREKAAAFVSDEIVKMDAAQDMADIIEGK